jgi:hypothetical protein
MLQLQANAGNLCSLGVSFGFLAKVSGRHALSAIRSAGLPGCGLWVINVARRQHESRKRKAPK